MEKGQHGAGLKKSEDDCYSFLVLLDAMLFVLIVGARALSRPSHYTTLAEIR